MLTTFYHLQSLLTSIYNKSGGISLQEKKEIVMLKKTSRKILNHTSLKRHVLTCLEMYKIYVDASKKRYILLVSSLTPIKSIILDRFKHHYFHPSFITRHVLTCQEIYESYIDASKKVKFFQYHP